MDEQDAYAKWRATADIAVNTPPAPATVEPVTTAPQLPKADPYIQMREDEQRRASERASLMIEQANEAVDVPGAMRRVEDARSLGIPVQADILLMPQSEVAQVIDHQTRRAKLAGSSKLSAWVGQDPVNAALAKADLDNMSYMSSLFSAMGRGGDNAITGYGARSKVKLFEEGLRTFEDQDKGFLEILSEAQDENSIYSGKGGLDPTGVVSLLSAADRYLMSRGNTVYQGVFGGEQKRDENVAVFETQLADALGEEQANAERTATSYGRYAPVTDFSRRAAEAGKLETAGEQIKALASMVWNEPGTAAAWMLTVTAESAPALVAGATTLAVTKNPTAAAGTMGLTSAAISEPQAFGSIAAQMGYDLSDPEQRKALVADPRMRSQLRTRSFAYAAVVGLMDAASGGVASQLLSKNATGNLILQAITQSAMGAGGETMGLLASGQRLNMTDIIVEGLAEFATAPLEVAGVGGVAGSKYIKGVRQTRGDRMFFEALASGAEGSKTRKDVPAKYREMVANLTKDGPVETLYVDADQLNQMFQSRTDGVTAEDFIRAMPEGDAEAFRTALVSGGTVKIPTSVYAADIVGTKFDALLRDHLKTSPERMSAFEARELEKQAGDLMKLAQETAEEVESGQRQLEAVAETARIQLVSSLRQAGQSTRVAEKNALQAVAMARTTAAREGMTIEQFLERYPLTEVRSELQEDPRAPGTVTAEAEFAVNAQLAGRKVSAEQIAEALQADGLDPETATAEQAIAASEKYLGDVTLNQDERGPGLDLENATRRLPDLERMSPGPVPGVRELASRYMAKMGFPVRHQARYATVDVERAREIARLYDEAPDAPNDPEVRAAYEALAAETIAQYEALLELGYTFEWITGDNPYDQPREAIIDMRDNKHLWVFPTTDGFGSINEASTDNPLLQPTKYTVDGRVALVNDLFRIVHDVFGHGSEGASFGPRGEENAWQAHVRMFSPLAARAMTSETRGQNSWVNYGPFGDQNRADPKNTVFADQKSVLLPEWVSTVGQTEDVGGGQEQTEMFQATALRRGTESLKRFGVDADKNNNTREVAAALEARQRKKWGTIDRDDKSPEAARKIADWMVEEVLFEVEAAKDAPERSAVGWYSEKFQRALDAFAEVFPELGLGPEGEVLPWNGKGRDPLPGVTLLGNSQNARDFFTALVAITSDGAKVADNFAFAKRLYEGFRTTGIVPTAFTFGNDRNASMKQNITILMEVLRKVGADKMRETLLQTATVSELKKMAKAQGLTFSSTYKADTKLPYSAILFGPKLGAFFANLMGDTGYLTMDRWWSRTFNRYRGNLLTKPTQVGLARFRELLIGDGSNSAYDMTDEEVLASTVPYAEAYKAKGFKNGTEIEKAANTLYKAGYVNTEDSPFNATDREFMIKTAALAQKSLARKGVDLTIADVQAVLWYYEKRLYAEQGAGKTRDVSYEEIAREIASGTGPEGQGDAAVGDPGVSDGLDLAAFESTFQPRELANWSPQFGYEEYFQAPAQRQRPVNDDGTITLTHWSDEPRDTITPEKAGSGPLKGYERNRRGPKKSFYGMGVGQAGGYRKEMLGPYMHTVKVAATDLYDLTADPEGRIDGIPNDVPNFQRMGWLEESLQADGYKGYTVTEGPQGMAAALFVDAKPEAVTDDRMNELFQSGATPVFFSELTRQVENAKQMKATAADWKAIIGKLPGVKQAEIAWSGVMEWLDTREGQIDRSRVAHFLRNNEVKIETVQRGRPKTVDLGYRAGDIRVVPGDNPTDVSERFGDGAVRQTVQFYDPQGNLLATDEPIVRGTGGWGRGEESYLDYINYQRQQIYRGLSNKLDEQAEQAAKLVGPSRFEQYTENGGTDYREVLMTVPALNTTGLNEGYEVDPFVNSGHFTEENIVVHTRMNYRKADDGKKVLFVEEVQSDLASDWRKSGEAQPGPAKQANKAEQTRLAEEKIASYEALQEAERAYRRAVKASETETDVALLVADDALIRARVAFEAADRAWVQAIGGNDYLERPQTPFEGEAVYALAMKQMLRMAAESGADRLAWTPGYMQARRWSGAVQNVLRNVTWEAAEVDLPGEGTKAKERLRLAEEQVALLSTRFENRLVRATLPYLGDLRPNDMGMTASAYIFVKMSGGVSSLPQPLPPVMVAYEKAWIDIEDNFPEGLTEFEDAYAELEAAKMMLSMGGPDTDVGREVALNGVNGTDVLYVDMDGVIVGKKNGGRIPAESVIGKNISELIGSGLAQKIASSDSGTEDANNIIIGGDGYKIAYDQTIKRFVEKFAKKYGSKVTVETGAGGMMPKPPTPVSLEEGVRTLSTDEFMGRARAAGDEFMRAAGWDALEERVKESFAEHSRSVTATLSNAARELGKARDALAAGEIDQAAFNTWQRRYDAAADADAYTNREPTERMLEKQRRLFLSSMLTSDQYRLLLPELYKPADQVWTVEITPEMKAAALEAQPLFQRRPDGARGSVLLPTEPGRAPVTNLFEGADLSTFLHESGHYFLHILQDIAKRGDGSASMQADWQTILQWWGQNIPGIAKDGGVTEDHVRAYLERGTTGDPLLDRAVNVGMQEQWARAYETYLMEGKAPSLALRSAFEAFSAWLMEVYRKVKGDLNVNVSSELREVFDRLLATDEEIAQAAKLNNMQGPLGASAEALGVSPEEYATLLRLGVEAQDDARQRMLASIMAPLRAAQTAEYKALRDKVTADVTEQVNSKPANRVREWLGNARWLGEGAPADIPEGLRLSKAILTDTYGADFVAKLPRGKFPLWVAEGGLDPDETAGWFGYGSGDEMLQDIMTSPKAADEIKTRVDTEMRKTYPDPLVSGKIEDEALEALHGEKRGQLIAAELRALSKSAPKGVMTTRSQAREIAQRTIARMPIRDAVRSGQYSVAAARAAERSQQLVAKGDLPAAFEEKRKQLLNHALYVASKEADAVLAATEAKVARLKSKGTRKNLAGEYLEAIDDILTSYDFRKAVSGRQAQKRAGLLAYVAMMTEAGRANELAIPAHVLDEAKRKPYKSLTTAELQGVLDALINIEHTARLKKRLRDAQNDRDMTAVVEGIQAELDANMPDRPSNWVRTGKDRIKDAGREFLNLVLNAETILMRMGGYKRGAAYDALKAPLDRAAAWAAVEREKASRALEALYSVYTRAEQNQMARKKFYKELGGSFSKWDLISLGLNMGNSDNLARLMDRDSGRGLNATQIEFIKATLDKRDWEFIQSGWDYINTFWSQIEARERRLTGVSPVKVQPAEVVTPYGTFAGGYYPIKYDGNQSAVVSAEDMEAIQRSTMAGRFAKAQTKNGHLETRAGGSGGRPLKLGIEVMHQHIGEVIHDLAFSEAVVNTHRILKDPRIAESFARKGLLQDGKALELWIQDVATGSVAGGGIFGRLALKAKSGFTLSKLAFNLGTVIVQPTGLFQSAVVVGPRNLVRGFSDYMSNPSARTREVMATSQFMRERETTFDRDVNDILGDITQGPATAKLDRLQQSLATIGLFAMQKVQFYAVDMPTWLGGYRQGLEMFGNDEDKATAHADRQVAAAQASGLFADRSAFERGTLSPDTRQNGFIRLFTALGSYMFAKANLAYRVGGATAKDIDGFNVKSLKAAISGATTMAVIFTLEAVAYQFLRGGLPGDDEDDEAWATFLARETMLSMMSTLPGVRDLGAAISGFDAGAYGSVLGTFAKALTQVGEGEADLTLFKSLSNAVGVITGLPSGQLNKTVSAWYKLEEGEDVSPLEFLMGPKN